MKSNDQKMLEEAYISAFQKSINVPAVPSEVTINQPDTPAAIEMHAEKPLVTDITSEEPEMEHECGCEEEHEESSMAKTNLFSIYRDAKMIHEIVEGGVELETWMLQKIAVVADKLSSVARSAEYHAAKGQE